MYVDVRNYTLQHQQLSQFTLINLSIKPAISGLKDSCTIDSGLKLLLNQTGKILSLETKSQEVQLLRLNHGTMEPLEKLIQQKTIYSLILSLPLQF